MGESIDKEILSLLYHVPDGAAILYNAIDCTSYTGDFVSFVVKFNTKDTTVFTKYTLSSGSMQKTREF